MRQGRPAARPRCCKRGGEQLLRPVRPLPVLLLHVTEELRQLLKGSGRRLRDVLLGMLHGPQTANGVVVIG
jgi:hypothetical protein